MTREARATAWLLAAATLFRLVYGARSALAYDEAYYWCWSRHLDYWYYDQGPWIAWAIRTGCGLFGENPFGVRVVGTLTAAATGWLAFLVARRWFDERVGLATAAALTVAPLLSAGGILATYDNPQVFFWALGLWTLTRALDDAGAGWWYATGAAVFCGLLAKVTMVFFLPGVLILLALHPPFRRWLRSPHPYQAGLLGVLALGAMLLWNQKHGNLYLLHTRTLGQRHTDAAPGRWLGDFVAGQALALGPGLLIAEVAGLAAFLRRPADAARRLVLAFALPMLAICVVNALRSKLEINWPVSAHVTGLMAAGWWLNGLWPRRRGAVVALLIPGVLLQALALFPQLPGALGADVPAKSGKKLNETFGWDQVAARVEGERALLGAATVAAVNYKNAAVLSFILPGKTEAACLFLHTRRNQFLLWTDPRTLLGKNVLLCLEDDETASITGARQVFESVEELPPLEITRAGYRGPLRRWHLLACRNFKGYDPESTADGY